MFTVSADAAIPATAGMTADVAIPATAGLLVLHVLCHVFDNFFLF